MSINSRFKGWLSKLFDAPRHTHTLLDVSELSSEQGSPQRTRSNAHQEKIISLLAELQHGDLPTKKKAIDGLANLGPAGKPAVPALVECLHSRDSSLARRAINALGKIGPASKVAVRPLLNTVVGQDRKSGRMASDALLLIDHKADVLIQALTANDPSLRTAAADILSRIKPGSKAAIPNLIGALNHPDKSVSSSISKALGRIGPLAVPALASALKRGNSRQPAIDSLMLIGRGATPAIPALVEVIHGSPTWDSLKAVEALGYIGPAALPTLNELLIKGSGEIRKQALSALARIGPEAKICLPALVAALEDPYVCSEAARVIGSIGPESQSTVPSLIHALASGDKNTQHSIAYAIKQIGVSAVPDLMIALNHPEANVRQGAADALAALGSDAASSIPALIKTLEDDVESVRVSAASAIIDIEPSEQRKAHIFIEAYAHMDPKVRDIAINSLVDIGPSVVPFLIDALSDERESIKKYVIQVLINFGRMAVPTLIKALKHTDVRVRAKASEALRRIYDTLSYSQIPIDVWGHVTTVAIDYNQPIELDLQRLRREKPELLEALYIDGLQFSDAPIRMNIGGPDPMDLNELVEMVGRRQALLLNIRDALDRAARTASAKPIQPTSLPEQQRYTDVTLYEGHLYPSDDLGAENPLADDVPLSSAQRYTMSVAIRLQRTGISAGEIASRGVKNIRRDKEDLIVYVLAKPQWEGIQIKEPLAKIIWPYNEDSEAALFRLDLEPVSAGNMSQGVIEVRLYDSSLDLLDVVDLYVTVVPGKLQGGRVLGVPSRHLSWPDKSVGILDVGQEGAKRLFSIHVRPSVEGYRFEFLFRGRDSDKVEIPITRDIQSKDLDTLLMKVRDFWTSLVIKNYAAQLTVTNTTYGKYLAELRDLGQEAWALLFGSRYGDQSGAPERLGELLTTTAAEEGSRIQITYGGGRFNDFIFPWSILYPTAAEGEVNALLFWGARYQIEQVIGGPKQDALADEPIDVMFALDRTFGNAESQENMWRRYESAAGGKLKVSQPISDQQALFQELVRKPSAHLLYFFCHGYAATGTRSVPLDGVELLRCQIEAIPEDAPERKALETLLLLTAKMSDESWIYIGDGEIRESKLKLQKFFEKRRPIVFLNMCQSAELFPSMSSGLVRVFLDHNASAVVGTESPMTAVFASAFAEVMFNELFGGDDIGSALWKARRFFLSSDIRNPLGLAYTLYGRATARLGGGQILGRG